MLFSIYVLGTQNRTLLFCNFDEEEVALPAVPGENPEIRVVQGSPEAATAQLWESI